MKLIFPYFFKHKYKLLGGILCMILVDAAQLVVPQVVRRAIDTLSVSLFDRTALMYQCLLVIFLGAVMALLRYAWRNLLMGSARSVEKGIRDDLFRHILTLDMPYFDRVKTGDIMAHSVSDINHVRMAFGFGLIALVDTILLGGATLAIMIWTHPKLTAIAMIPMPFLIIVTRTLGRRMYAFHKTAQESFSELTEIVRESFFGIRILKVFNFENSISQKVETASKDYFAKNLKRAVVTALMRPMLALFFNISIIVIIFYGGWLVMQKAVTPGELVAFIQYLAILAWPVIAIGWMTNLFQRGMASLKRINKLLDSVPSVSQSENPAVLETLDGRIQFRDVAFSYTGDTHVLSGISLDIQKGEKIGICGPPGAGKTTFAQLVARLYDAQSGQVLLDDIDIKSIDLPFLRQQIAFMPQESFLFSGTIKENILMGRDISAGSLDRMLDTCSLKTTIEQMPDGLDTIVGERGITLSGGQKQRIALARTLIHPGPITILDDPISQIDTHTAFKIINGINRLNLDATVITISHRISALASCDRIYILKNGRIESSGSHQELIQDSPFYRQSYQVQQFEESNHD